MFRCSDCNAEYKIKPDYCECGNNSFAEIPEKLQAGKTASMPTGQIISVIIFALCLVFSTVIWLIPVKKNKPEHKQAKVEKIKTNVPDIEKIWNNTSAKPETKIPTQPSPPIIETEPVKPEPEVVKPPAEQKKTVAKPVTKQKTAVSQKPQTKPQKPEQKTINQKPLAKPATSQQTVNTAPQRVIQKPVMDKVAYENYKNQLRLVLLSKLDLTKITGEGDCAVKFRLDNSGKLLNRGFIYQSSNKSLNDQVYYMLMQLPSYKAPPEGYDGETIKLKLYINNGYYEISFIN